MLTASEPALEGRARALSERLSSAVPAGRFQAVRVRSAIGGGALPTVEPWSWAVEAALPGLSEDALEAQLRAASRPVIGRVAEGRLLLDVRTVFDHDWDALVSAFQGEGGA